ncbi:MAG: EVE domain-containing protein, partial [Bdellovibrionota bacterium]
MAQQHWLLKTEPGTYSFERLLKERKAHWDGVRNFQARNNLRLMAKGDLALIYHSGDDKAVVG